MKDFTRSEQIALKTAFLLDEYEYEYHYYEYADQVGTEELARVKHVNLLIQELINDFSSMYKYMAEEFEYLIFEYKDSGEEILLDQLGDSFIILKLMALLNEAY